MFLPQEPLQLAKDYSHKVKYPEDNFGDNISSENYLKPYLIFRVILKSDVNYERYVTRVAESS